jgi:[ribosomal protein S5]-alanine N-acetyltransferase
VSVGAPWRLRRPVVAWKPHILLGVPLVFPDPALAADGIVLRRLEPGDVPWITAACSDRELSRYIPAIPYPYAEADARGFIERATRAWADSSAATFVISQAPDGAGLGTIGLHLAAGDTGLAEVGYWLAREARGHGAATIAVQLVSRWAFTELGIERLSLQTATGNVASQRVAERAGFTREGLLRAWMPTPDGRRHSVMFSLLPADTTPEASWPGSSDP